MSLLIPNHNEKLLLIDGDYITFSSASSADGRTYKIGGEEFRYKKDADYFCSSLGFDNSEIILEYHPEPVENALHNAKLIIEGIKEGCGSTNIQIYIHGSGNFREDIYPDYKGHRKDLRRPFHEQNVKDYMKSRYGAIEVFDEETDDRLGIEQMRNEDTIIVSHDKDLDMIPGWHYRVRYGKPSSEGNLYFVDELEAYRNFYLQCLTGDSTDNIPGLYKITGKRASKRIKEGLQECITPNEMWRYVLNQYGGENAGYLIRTAKLLWIRRKEGEIWEKPSG